MDASAVPFCPVCKIENLPGTTVCAFCSAPLYPDTAGFSTTLEVPETSSEKAPDWTAFEAVAEEDGRIVLFVADSVIRLDVEPGKPFILGRNLEKIVGTKGEMIVDLTSFEAYEKGVSRQHILVRPVEGGFVASDLDSTNGTWLNERRMLPGRFYPLETKSEIRMGQLYVYLLFPTPNRPDVMSFQNTAP
jgi:hypothetical protein